MCQEHSKSFTTQYNIHTHTHTLILRASILCQTLISNRHTQTYTPVAASKAIYGPVSCLRTLWWADWRSHGLNLLIWHSFHLSFDISVEKQQINNKSSNVSILYISLQSGMFFFLFWSVHTWHCLLRCEPWCNSDKWNGLSTIHFAHKWIKWKSPSLPSNNILVTHLGCSILFKHDRTLSLHSLSCETKVHSFYFFYIISRIAPPNHWHHYWVSQ